MICVAPIGLSILLISFMALKVFIARTFKDYQENIIVKIDVLTRGIQATLGFALIYFVTFILDLTQDFIHLSMILCNLSILNAIALYIIVSRPQLKSFIVAKFYSSPYIPKHNTVEISVIA